MREVNQPFPASTPLMTGFARGRNFDEDQDFLCPIQKSAAGLVAAHQQFAQAVPHPDDIEVTLAGAELAPRIHITGEFAPSFFRAVEEILGYKLTIDLDAHAALGEPKPRAEEHHESIGAVIGRLAYLYTIAHPRAEDVPLYDWPVKTFFINELARYDRLVKALTRGELRLPPLTRTSA